MWRTSSSFREARGQGAGRALMATLARRCLDERLGRLEWAVLDWNAPAIGVYDSLGAESLNDWTVRRVSGAARSKPWPGKLSAR